MQDYNRILEEAITSYREMPFETKELYKKYTLNLQVPAQREGAASNGELDSLRKQIINESRLRFDLVNGANGFESKSEFVKVINKKPGKKQEGAETNAPEEKLGDYITKTSGNTVAVEIPDKKEVKLNLLMLCDNVNLPLEIVIDVGKDAKLNVFEWFGSTTTEGAIIAPFHVIKVGERSDVEVNILHNENSKTTVGSLNKANVEEKASLRFNVIYNGGGLTRTTTFAEAAGKESNLLVNEIVFGHAEQKFDVNTFLLNSNEFTKAMLRSGAVLRGKSYCILKGYAKVARNTRGSYSNVEEKGLVMDPDSRIQPLPDMSIDCKDVAFASHSASTAPVDKEALFYLMSRGIDETKAKRIFVASFISKYLADIENDIVKEVAISILLDKLDNDRHSQVPRISMQNLWIVPSERAKK